MDLETVTKTWPVAIAVAPGMAAGVTALVFGRRLQLQRVLTELPIQVFFSIFGFDAWAIMAIHEGQFFISPGRSPLSLGTAFMALAVLLVLFHIVLLVGGLATFARWADPDFVDAHRGEWSRYVRDGALSAVYGIVLIGSCYTFVYYGR